MDNYLHDIVVEIRRLTAAEAEVWITAKLDAMQPGTELRGKLVGPRCPGATTVEVAYPLRPLSRAEDEPGNALTVRAVVPEPNLWTEKTPFVYECRLELWQQGTCVDRNTQMIGLKQTG